jgi:hypothetical protein
MLERLGFSAGAATYLTGSCGINSLDEIAFYFARAFVSVILASLLIFNELHLG